MVEDDYIIREEDLLSEIGRALFVFRRKRIDNSMSNAQLISSFTNHAPSVIREKDLLKQHTDYKPNLDDVLDYYRSRDVVGEENVCILQTLGAINKLCFGIESFSGSGKSFLVNALIDLLPQGAVYRMELSSNTAEFYQAAEINQCDVIYIPELQKAMSNKLVVEILKNLTEGRSAIRTVRDQALKQNLIYTISADKGVIFTLASENPFKYDKEFSRRVFILHTDISPEQTDRILKHKAMNRHQSLENRVANNFKPLRAHIARCLEMDFKYENPFTDYISQQIPRNIKARSYDDHLFNLINACTKFHYPKRLFGNGVLFVSIGDVYHIYNAYWEQFIHNLLGIPVLGEEVMDIFTSKELFLEHHTDAQSVHKALKQKNFFYPFNVVKRTLEQLVDSGFLEKDDYEVRNPAYRVMKSIPNFHSFDWQACWESGIEFIDKYQPKLLNAWVSSQTDDLTMIKEIKLEGNDPWIKNLT